MDGLVNLFEGIGRFLIICGIFAIYAFFASVLNAIQMETDAAVKEPVGDLPDSRFKEYQLKLIAMLMKADGHTTKGELSEFKRYWTATYGEKDCAYQLKKLQRLLNTNSDTIEICLDITRNTKYLTRLELLRTFFAIAAADEIDDNELSRIKHYAHYLNIRQPDFDSVFALYSHTYYGWRYRQTPPPVAQSADWAYTALEISPTASDDEVKKAYRLMAMRFHPDKQMQAGEAAYQSATEKFQALGQAYEAIKRERGMN